MRLMMLDRRFGVLFLKQKSKISGKQKYIKDEGVKGGVGWRGGGGMGIGYFR